MAQRRAARGSIRAVGVACVCLLTFLGYADAITHPLALPSGRQVPEPLRIQVHPGGVTVLALRHPGDAPSPRASTLSLVTFLEEGLPSGTSWWVILDGVQQSATAPTIEFNAANGNHSYFVATGEPWRWWPAPCNGTVVVSGSAVQVPVRWDPLVELELQETGLPAGTNWSATLSGAAVQDIFPEIVPFDNNVVTAWSEGNDSVAFYVDNGTYEYEERAPGYSSPSGGTIIVSGADRTVNVTFPTASAEPAPWAMRSTIAVVGAALAIGAVAALIVLARRRRRP